jgi:hypothetical protein
MSILAGPTSTSLVSRLTTQEFDWSNFDQAGALSRLFLRDLVDDRRTLRTMIYGIEDNPELLKMSERHQLLDYLVLYEAPKQGFRIRLHIWTDDYRDRPHDHRFSFSSIIIKGRYLHTLYRADKEVYLKEEDEISKAHKSRFEPTADTRLDSKDLIPLYARDEMPSSMYSMHHSQLHTTETTPDTVSLFIRGPAEKQRSLIMDRRSGQHWWRFGRVDEGADQEREGRVMTRDDYIQMRDRMHALDVI